MTSRSALRLVGLSLLLVLAGTSLAHAQRTTGSVGFGGQIGETSGLTLKVYNETALSYDFLAAWDLDDFFFLNGRALWNQDINAENINQITPRISVIPDTDGDGGGGIGFRYYF